MLVWGMCPTLLSPLTGKRINFRIMLLKKVALWIFADALTYFINSQVMCCFIAKNNAFLPMLTAFGPISHYLMIKTEWYRYSVSECIFMTFLIYDSMIMSDLDLVSRWHKPGEISNELRSWFSTGTGVTSSLDLWFPVKHITLRHKV